MPHHSSHSNNDGRKGFRAASGWLFNCLVFPFSRGQTGPGRIKVRELGLQVAGRGSCSWGDAGAGKQLSPGYQAPVGLLSMSTSPPARDPSLCLCHPYCPDSGPSSPHFHPALEEAAHGTSDISPLPAPSPPPTPFPGVALSDRHTHTGYSSWDPWPGTFHLKATPIYLFKCLLITLCVQAALPSASGDLDLN